MAASFVRCEDPALLAQAVAAAEELQLRALAPTVAVSPAPIAEVLARVAGRGLRPGRRRFLRRHRRRPAARGPGAHAAAAPAVPRAAAPEHRDA